MVARLGDVLYWAASGVAALLAAFVLMVFMLADGKGEPIFQVLGVVIAGIIWLIGRACRYVLAGK